MTCKHLLLAAALVIAGAAIVANTTAPRARVTVAPAAEPPAAVPLDGPVHASAVAKRVSAPVGNPGGGPSPSSRPSRVMNHDRLPTPPRCLFSPGQAPSGTSALSLQGRP